MEGVDRCSRCVIVVICLLLTSLRVASPKSQQTIVRLSIWHILRGNAGTANPVNMCEYLLGVRGPN